VRRCEPAALQISEQHLFLLSNPCGVMICRSVAAWLRSLDPSGRSDDAQGRGGATFSQA
jgi:hypothetical protein